MFLSLDLFITEVCKVCSLDTRWDWGTNEVARVSEDSIWSILNKWWPNITLVQYKLKVEPCFDKQYRAFLLKDVFDLFVEEGLIFKVE